MRRAHEAAVMHVHVGQVIAWIVQEAILGARVLGEKILQLGPSIEKAVAVGQMRVGREPARHTGIGVRNLIERRQLGRFEIIVGHLVADDDLRRGLCVCRRRKAARQQQRDG